MTSDTLAVVTWLGWPGPSTAATTEQMRGGVRGAWEERTPVTTSPLHALSSKSAEATCRVWLNVFKHAWVTDGRPQSLGVC